MKHIILVAPLLFASYLTSAESDICQQVVDDKNGYLKKICQHIVKNKINISPGKAHQYQIKNVINITENGKNYVEVQLSCCYMGDRAVIDPETGKVIRFSLGSK